jgi:hypothetical protein
MQFDMRIHGGPSIRETTFIVSPSQRRTAPNARTARRMDDYPGRSPDSRVDAPFPPSRAGKPSGYVEKNSPLTVAGAVAELADASPHSHLADLSTNEPEPDHN